MAPSPRRSIPVDDETWTVICEAAERDDRSPYTQASRWLRQKARVEKLQTPPVEPGDDLN